MSLLVFLVFFISGSALGMFMQTASLEEEFTGAAADAAFLGRDWTGVMSPVGSISGFLRGIPYLPTMLCPDPVFQYKLFMLINSAAYALIPLSAFRLTEKLGVTKLWQRLLVTALCGIFPSVLIYSHYLLSEPLSAVFGFYCLSYSEAKRKTGKKQVHSLLRSPQAFLPPVLISCRRRVQVCSSPYAFTVFMQSSQESEKAYISAHTQ